MRTWLPLANLVEQFGALDDDALLQADPGSDQHPLAVERFDPHRARLEALRADVFEHQILAVGAAYDARARHGEPALLLADARKHCHELPDSQSVHVTLYGEMHRDRLVAIGKARTLIGEGDALPRAGARGRALGPSQRVEAQRLDPQPRRIDDVEHHRIRLRHLPGDGRSLGNDAGDRRNQRLGLAPHLVEGNAPILEALEFELRFVELHARDRAAWGERLVAGDTPCDDRDLLIELALALAHIGHIDRLH